MSDSATGNAAVFIWHASMMRYSSMRASRLIVGSLALLCAGPWLASVAAAEVGSVHVHRRGSHYLVSARVRLAVPRERAYAAATDFAALPDYAPMIISSQRLGPRKLASKVRLCVEWFCKTVSQVMRYTETPPTRLDFRLVPDKGDFKWGRIHWRFMAAGGKQSTLLFNANIVPAFWIPPVIGLWAVRHSLRRQIASTSKAIETLAARLNSATGS